MASIWVPWSPSDPKKLWCTDRSIQIHMICVKICCMFALCTYSTVRYTLRFVNLFVEVSQVCGVPAKWPPLWLPCLPKIWILILHNQSHASLQQQQCFLGFLDPKRSQKHDIFCLPSMTDPTGIPEWNDCNTKLDLNMNRHLSFLRK